MFLQDTFSLGKWDRSTVTGDGEDLVRPSEQGAEEGGTIVLEVRVFRVFISRALMCHVGVTATALLLHAY